MNIERSICEAIELIVNRSIEKANYDKTIQATIITCVDETIGKYKVRYKDSTFFAYSTSLDITYAEKSLVYILIPNNDFSSNKTILGTTEKLGINYIPTIEDIDYYDIIGKNCIEDNSNTFGLCSYRKNKYVKVLYSKDFSESENLIHLNKEDLNQYLVQSDNLICGATIKTGLPQEQQFKGNYGIIFALDFLDNSMQEKVTRYYTLDVNNIRGNPYKILTDTRQYGIFPIDGKNFVEVNYISIFNYGFPNFKDDELCVDDIFIKDFEIQGSVRIENNEIDGVLLTLLTKKGLYFDSTFSDEDELSIEALVKVKGRIADNDTQNIKFYWFIEHTGITLNSTYYNSYGGQGWKCLNEYNVIKAEDENNEDIVEWIPAKSLFIVKKKDVIAKKNKYKCVAVYEGTIVEKTVVIKNLDSNYDISIISDSGTQFYFDNGKPTLTCLVNGIEETSDEYVYSWGATNNNNIFSSLNENINEEYSNIIVEKNTIRNINVNTITNFNIFQCTVYKAGIYLGTASLKISNSLSNDDLSYSIVINNGSEVYKYNENGISPASSTLESPIEIKQLSFIVYDRSGNPIKDDVIKNADIRWEIPLKNTLLSISNFKHEDYEEDNEKNIGIYKNALTLSYEIDDRYDISATNNTIRLFVTYNGIVLSASTNFTFLKEGEPGSNGTEFVCKIVPNIVSGEVPDYPMITQDGLTNGSSWSINYAPNPATTFFKVQLWRNGVNIFSGTRTGTSQEGKEVQVAWSILQNKYSASVTDNSSFTVNSETGAFGNYKGYDLGAEINNGWKAAIVKVSVKYDNLMYYATLPIVERKIVNKNTYDISLKDKSGFKYAIYSSDGTKPRYDNTNPFEIIVKEYSGGEWNDISLSDDISYDWNIKGKVYLESKYINGNFVQQWIDSLYLEDSTRRTSNPDLGIEADSKNICILRPKSKYDGYCVTNAIECTIKKNNSEIGRINIPIHLLLNRYFNSDLNSWDGNSISINENGGFILSPQVGAGYKEDDNSFTGVVLGSVKEDGKTETETGLFEFFKGNRSIFLDAKTGRAEFGTSDSGKIVIDPSSREALIYSSNYSDTGNNKGGLMINLTKPEIKFGTGNFYVDKDGKLHCTEATISGDGTGLDLSSNSSIADLNDRANDLGSNISNLDGSIITLSGKVTANSQNFNSIYRSTIQIYDTSSLGNATIVYGYDTPNTEIYPPNSNRGKYYIDKNTGYYYYCNGSYWSKYSTPLPLITSNLSSSMSEIKQTADNVSITVKGMDGKYFMTQINADKSGVSISGDKLNLTGSQIVSIISRDKVQIKAENIELSGDVVFKKDLSTSGSTQINAGNITTGYISASRISGGTLYLGGTNNTNGVLIIRDSSNRQIGKWDKDGLTVDIGSISANLISGGTLYLGGVNNANGVLIIRDSNSTQIGKWDNTGIQVNKGYIGNIELSGSMIRGWNTDKSRFIGIKASDDNGYAIAVGVTNVNNWDTGPFGVRQDGSLKSTKGKIGGFTITENSLSNILYNGSFKEVEFYLYSDMNQPVISIKRNGAELFQISHYGDIECGSIDTGVDSIYCGTLDANTVHADTLYIDNYPGVGTGGRSLVVQRHTVGGSDDNSHYYGKVYIAANSSEKYKIISKKIEHNEFDALYNITPVWAKYKPGYLAKGDERENIYFPMLIAEDVDKYIPLAVDHFKNGDPDDWNYRVLIPIIIQCLKELKKDLTILQRKEG